MTILPMCSELSSPTRFQVLPASVGLVDAVAEVRAALAVVLARAEPDDVRVLGSTTTQQRLNAGPSSKIGVKVTPRFAVFHSPPNAVATYHTFWLFGIDLDVGDAAGDEPGPDRSNGDALQRIRIQLPAADVARRPADKLKP